MNQRKFIVTGASKGIGAAICDTLINAGHSVIGIARYRGSQPQATAFFIPVKLDLSKPESISPILKQVLKDHPDISGLINNAGSGLFSSLEQFSEQQIQDSLNLNLLAPVLLSRALLPHLKCQQRSDLIFIGSESALKGARYGSIYCAAKFGLRGFAQSLRHECSSNNTHVGIVNPGMVSSSFFDELHFRPGPEPQHSLTPYDVANAVYQMLSSEDNAVMEEVTINPLQHVVQKK